MSNQSIPEGLTGIFPPAYPLQGMTGEAIARLLEIEPAPTENDSIESTDGWPEPEPLGSDLPNVPQFDPELLPASLRPLVEDVAERMQVPLDFPAIAAIATLAGMTNHVHRFNPNAMKLAGS